MTCPSDTSKKEKKNQQAVLDVVRGTNLQDENSQALPASTSLLKTQSNYWRATPNLFTRKNL